MAGHNRKGRGPMGGIILILVGVFFLLQSLLPGVKLWPYVLIAIGIIWVAASYLRKSPEE